MMLIQSLEYNHMDTVRRTQSGEHNQMNRIRCTKYNDAAKTNDCTTHTCTSFFRRVYVARKVGRRNV